MTSNFDALPALYLRRLHLYAGNARAAHRHGLVQYIDVPDEGNTEDRLRPRIEDGVLLLPRGRCVVDGRKRTAHPVLVKAPGVQLYVCTTSLRRYSGNRKADYFTWFFRRSGSLRKTKVFSKPGFYPCPDDDARALIDQREAKLCFEIMGG